MFSQQSSAHTRALTVQMSLARKNAVDRVKNVESSEGVSAQPKLRMRKFPNEAENEAEGCNQSEEGLLAPPQSQKRPQVKAHVEGPRLFCISTI